MKISNHFSCLARRCFSSVQDSTREAYELDRLVKKHVFGFTVIPQGYQAIVERLGRFHSILEPGSFFLVPGIDRITHYFPLHQVSLHTRPKEVLTQDLIPVHIASRIRVAIVDPKKAAYVAKTPFLASLFDAESALQETVSRYSLQQILQERPKIEETAEKTRIYGVECFVHEISDIKLPSNIEKTLFRDLVARQEANALIVRAQAEAESSRILAYAKVDSLQMIAQAETESLKIVEMAIEENPTAASVLLAKQTLNIVENSLKEPLSRIKEKKRDI
jgi:regulator of protease activity HflC (stomatin/prohibitin superfamily)